MDSTEPKVHDYSALDPDTLLDAIESLGYQCTGQLLALNSYENRVWRINLENQAPIIAKFYRPLRWSDAGILEEHQFAAELAAQEIPIVAPQADDQGTTLHTYQGYRFTLFPMQSGRWPDLEQRHDLQQMGRFIGRIHAVGKIKPFRHRPEISIERLGVAAMDYLLEHSFLPLDIETAYQTLAKDLLQTTRQLFNLCSEYTPLRLHGDCHRSNILWNENGPHFVDLDDCCRGPAIQDLWMMLSGNEDEMRGQLAELLSGYQQFADFDLRQLHLIEALRTLRMMHYAAWLAKRWEDPAFPQAFPWFNTQQYWQSHILDLREQLARMQEPVLMV